MTDTSASARPKTPWHYWVVLVVALLAAAASAADYVLTQIGHEQYLAMFTPEQVAYFTNLELWKEVVWALGVWTGVLAVLLFLLRRAWAVSLFVLSLLFTVVFFGACLMDPVMRATMMEPVSLAMTALVLVFGVFLIVYSRAMHRRGVLR